MDKLTCCASCGADLEPRSGAGRPSAYCSETCRRMAEFAIRGLVRRLDKAEIELRELKAESGLYDDDERRQRVRALRRWIKQDSAKLRALLGAKESNFATNNQIQSTKGNEP